jgi:hypothetical protein
MKEFGCVMHGTVAVVVVANGTVKQMVTEDAVKSFASRRVPSLRGCNHVHAICGSRTTGSYKLSVDLNHARITGLDGPKLRVITDLRYFDLATINEIDQALSRLNCLRLSVNGRCHVRSTLHDDFWMVVYGARMRKAPFVRR